MAAGVEVTTTSDTGTRVIAAVQLAIGVLLALAYVVLVGPTLVDVWTEDSGDIAFGQLFFTITAAVAVVVVGLSLLTAWEVWRSARDDRFDGTARVLITLQAVTWGAAALVVAVRFVGDFEARPGALVASVTITLFSVVAGWWLSRRDRG